MKNKFFFGAFVGILALLGISLDNTPVVNQELVIQFSDTDSPNSSSKNAITLIKSELQSIAVDHLKIETLVNGSLKISYYSTIDASLIKKQLSEAIGSNLTETSYKTQGESKEFPYEKNSENYSIDIYKTQDTHDIEGISTDIVEPKLETTRSSNIELYAFTHNNKAQTKAIIEQVAYQVFTIKEATFDTSSHKIPEVRAGPYTS